MTDSAHSPAHPARAAADSAAPTGQGGDHAMPAVVAETLGGLSADGLRQFFARETARYTTQRAETRAALRAGADAYMGGVPMHWMRDWPLPYPLVITRAEEARLTDLDGYEIDDFCLGDGAAPYGHTPEPVVKAIRKQAERGMSFLLPTRRALDAGQALSALYGDFRWQIALSGSDANRNAVKLARAVTRREKVLVFNGAYHGAVDDLMVRAERGRTKQRRGLVGQVHDLRRGAVAVEFNDLAAVEAALATGEVAAILTAPVLTHCGLVLPAEGFLAGLRALATRHGALLIFDESDTHTAARGGYARTAGVTPDVLVIGKGVAAGLPAAVWGVSDEVAGRFAAYDALRAPGHTGMGNALAGNALQAAALLATLTEVATPKAFAKMERGAARLAEGLGALFARFGLPWQVAHVGGRVAFTCSAQPVTNGTEAAAAAMPALEKAIHIGLLNRGCLISPYRNAMLVSPATGKVQIARLLTAFEDVLVALSGAPRAPTEGEGDAPAVAAAAAKPVQAAPAVVITPAPVSKQAASDDAPAPAKPRRGWWQKVPAGETAVVEAAVAEAPAPAAPAPQVQPRVSAASEAKAVTAEAQPASRRRGWWQGASKPVAPEVKAGGNPAEPTQPAREVVEAAAPAPKGGKLADPVTADTPGPKRRGWWQKG